jgi:hypothetical protein
MIHKNTVTDAKRYTAKIPVLPNCWVFCTSIVCSCALRFKANNANGAVKMHNPLSFDKFAPDKGNYFFKSKCKCPQRLCSQFLSEPSRKISLPIILTNSFCRDHFLHRNLSARTRMFELFLQKFWAKKTLQKVC